MYCGCYAVLFLYAFFVQGLPAHNFNFTPKNYSNIDQSDTSSTKLNNLHNNLNLAVTSYVTLFSNTVSHDPLV